jgi:hypothetical protein
MLSIICLCAVSQVLIKQTNENERGMRELKIEEMKKMGPQFSKRSIKRNSFSRTGALTLC